MQPEKIILIQPTHEQSVYAFHVEESLAEGFTTHLKSKGIVPWHEPQQQPLKPGKDQRPVVQIEFESNRSANDLEAIANDYLSQEARNR